MGLLDNISAAQPPSAYDIMRRYAIDAQCERTGHVWLDMDPRWDTPLSVRSDGLVSGKYGRYERRSAWCLSALAARPLPPCTLPPLSIEGETQLAALNLAATSPVSVVTGGPGTGKTTIAGTLAKSHHRTLGLSPTGKGADRLSESLGRGCYTIHRACALSVKEDDDALDFADYDLIVCDESGMLGVDTIHMLVSAIYRDESQARVVFFGDEGQLPSISPGRVLSGLTHGLPHAGLDIVYRYSDIDIGIACEYARDGHLHVNQTDFYSISEGDINDAWHAYIDMSRKYGIDESRLITYHSGDAIKFNRLARQRLTNKPPVVCVKNDYRWPVFNGQQGYEHGKHLVFGDVVVPSSSIHWEYAYAATCHRSQGGQWGGVVVWIPSARYISREWLRTALSRAVSSLAVVVRDAATTERVLTSSRATKRRSLLGEFLKGERDYGFAR